MNDLKELIFEILKEIEEKDSIVSRAGGLGYGSGKIYSKKSVGVLKMLGREFGEEPTKYTLEPVKVSKVFKRRRKKK